MILSPKNQSLVAAEKIIHLLYGTQAYNGDYHLNGFTAQTIEHSLSSVGLSVVDARIRDEWLFALRARKADCLSDPAEFIHNAYFRILGRPVDSSGLAHYSAALAEERLTRNAIEQELVAALKDDAGPDSVMTDIELTLSQVILLSEENSNILAENKRILKQNTDISDENENLRAQLDIISSSRSWKITSPMRSMVKMLGINQRRKT